MKVITLSNEKGGCGKTTTAIHLAAGLAVKGLRVLLIDADAQANATIGIGMVEEPGFYNLLVRKAGWRDVLKVVQPEVYEPPNQPSQGMLAILPGNTETQLIQHKIQDAYAIHKRLNELQSVIDVVVIDTSPTPSLLHGAIYLATDAILYPTQCEKFSIHGLIRTIENVQSAPDKVIQTLGIVPNMYRHQTVEHSENLNDLRNEYGDVVMPPIHLSIAWSEANTMCRTVFSMAPASAAAEQMWTIVDQAAEVMRV